MSKIRNTILSAKQRYVELPKQIKASFWFLICSFLQKGISVITTPIFTRLLSTVEYGKFNIFNSWLNVIQIIVTLNLTAGVYTQGLVKFRDDRKVFSSSIQGLTFSLCLVWLVIYYVFAEFWNRLFSLTTPQMFFMFILIWASSVFNQWAAEKRVELKYSFLVVVTIAVSIMKPLMGILLVTHAEDKVTARILGLVIVELIGYSGFFFLQLYKGKVFFHKKYWIYALRFNIPLVPHYLSQSILNSADRIMIERMIGTSESGIYSLAYSLSFLMTLFNTALLQTINPWIFQKIKDDKEEEINPVAIITLFVVASVNLLLIYLAPEIIYVFAPKDYGDAIYVIPPIAMSVYFIFASYFFVDYELYHEKTIFVTIATIFSAAINIILNYVFIRIYGYYAAGYTTLACYMLYVIGHYFFMQRILYKNEKKQFYNIKLMITISFVFLGVGFFALFTYDHQYFRLGVLVAMCLLAIWKRKLIIQRAKMIIKLKKR